MESEKITEEKVSNYKERFVRWQEIRINQLGYINNLIIALASGILLWQAQFLLSDNVNATDHIFYILSAILFFISMVVGLCVAWIRFQDFSLTAQISRSLMASPPSEADGDTKKARKEMREKTEEFGNATRKSLFGQFVLFFFGFLFLAIDVIRHIFYK